MSDKTRWVMLLVFALAMAWVEAAVVVYLRTLVGRIEPYQPDPLPISVGLGWIELVREAATLVMLLTAGWLAGRTWRSRLSFAMLAFGLWDILYYVFLVPMSGWPRTLLDWDILFLLPLPWWGPVLAPVSIALLMIAYGTLVGQFDRPGEPLWARRSSLALGGIGVLFALYAFMADALQAAARGTEAIRQVLPASFNWAVFALALALMAIPAVDVGRQVWTRRSRPMEGHWNASQADPARAD